MDLEVRNRTIRDSIPDSETAPATMALAVLERAYDSPAETETVPTEATQPNSQAEFFRGDSIPGSLSVFRFRLLDAIQMKDCGDRLRRRNSNSRAMSAIQSAIHALTKQNAENPIKTSTQTEHKKHYRTLLFGCFGL